MLSKEKTQKYLDRIGFAEEISVTKEVLGQLIWKHLTKVPFENLEIFDEGKVPSVEVEDVYRKIVENKRGGCCFELNGLFYEILAGIFWNVKERMVLSR